MSSEYLHKSADRTNEQKAEESKRDTPREIYIDHGPPLPKQYGVDKVRLLVQNPTTITAQWELSGGIIGTIPEAGDTPQKLIKLLDLTRDSSLVHTLDPFADNWWFGVEPDTQYRVDIGVRVDGRDVWLLQSNIVHTPRNTVSDEVDGKWMMLNEQFRQLLLQGGFSDKRFVAQHLGASMGIISSSLLSEALFSGSLVSGQNIYGSLSSMTFGTRGKI